MLCFCFLVGNCDPLYVLYDLEFHLYGTNLAREIAQQLTPVLELQIRQRRTASCVFTRPSLRVHSHICSHRSPRKVL